MTDERIHELMAQTVNCQYGEGIKFARAIEQEVIECVLAMVDADPYGPAGYIGAVLRQKVR